MIIAANPIAYINDATLISMISDDNFYGRKDSIPYNLEYKDFDLMLLVNEPSISRESNMPREISTYKKWEQSNCLSLILIKS